MMKNISYDNNFKLNQLKVFCFCKMQNFLLSFLLLLSCAVNSGYTEIVTNKINLKRIITNNVNSLDQQFQCQIDDDCQSLISESKCISKVCKCGDDKVLSSDASKCLTKAKELGFICEENIQCSSFLTSGGICENNKCACKTGYHYLRGACWKNIDLNEKCVVDEQCFATYEYVGMKCENKICKCRQNYYERLNSGCRRQRKKSESCNLDSDCEEGTCESMKCSTPTLVKEKMNNFSNTTVEQEFRNVGKCPKGMFELEEKCALELGMKCKKNEDCKHIENAVCLDNLICACEPVLYVASENNRMCLRVVRGKVDDIYRSSCKSDSQCGVFGPNSYCQDKRCACKNGTYFEVKEKFCWKIKSVQESCTDNRDCHPSVTNAECSLSEKKCLCRKGYHQKGDGCVPDALEVGDSCENDEDCLLPNSVCNSTKVCACAKHYYFEKGQCRPGVGTSCKTNEDCSHLKNTECKTEVLPEKRCFCKERYTNSNDYKYCLPVANHKETCEESFQCELTLGNLGECRNKRCECQEGTHHFYGKCHKSKFAGQICTKIQDCFPGNDNNSVICLRGFCSCNYGYELDKGKFCVKTNSATSIKFYSTMLTSLLLFLIIR